MKKYVIKIVTEDLNNHKKYLEYWHNMEDRFKQDDYQIRRKKALEKKILTIERYLERLLIIL